MRIAQVAPTFESVPPMLYGGTERVVSTLTEELVLRGHDVTLFASADSVTKARLIPSAARGLRLQGVDDDHLMVTVMELANAVSRSGEFDVIHSHVEHVGLPFTQLTSVPILTTVHGRIDGRLDRFFSPYAQAWLVSISESQRQPAEHLNWVATVHNGVDFARYSLRDQPGAYLAFLGRISPEKRVDRAIEIARALDMPLKIAAKVGAADEPYFEHGIRPLLDQPLVEFVGEINDAEKDDFLGGAYALLFPIDWPEPFGLTMVEAMACGTPVIATNCGAVPEVVMNGVTGFVCDSMRSLMQAVPRVRTIDRAVCRAVAEERFSAQRMADAYEAVYERLVGDSKRDRTVHGGSTDVSGNKKGVAAAQSTGDRDVRGRVA